MRITTKRIRVIEMTREEHAKFLLAMKQAAEGQTVNYAEERLDDGSYLGVSVVSHHTPPEKQVYEAKGSKRAPAFDRDRI